MDNDPIPYGRQSIGPDDLDAVAEALAAPLLTTGPTVAAFEEALCRTTDAPHAVAVANGTAALHLLYEALGVGPGKTVIVPANTFVATASAARLLGADVMLADVDPETGLLTPETLAGAIARAPGATLAAAVHYAGQSCDMPGLAEVAGAHGVDLIEDACHALGATQTAGSGTHPMGSARLSRAATFSFHPVKTITTAEGGAVTTRDADLAARIRLQRSHGLTKDPGAYDRPRDHRDRVEPWHYRMLEPGFNYRISDLQCALGLSQLQRLPGFIAERARLVARYEELLAPFGAHLVPIGRVPTGTPGWHLFPVRLCDGAPARADLYHALHKRGIQVQVHYVPLYDHPAFEAATRAGSLVPLPETIKDAFPGAQAFYESVLSLPLYPDLTDAAQDRVVAAIGDVFGAG